jgi:UDP-N-acetylglucosamine 4-epimerase
MVTLFNQNKAALNTVYNTAFGERTTLNENVSYLKNTCHFMILK